MYKVFQTAFLLLACLPGTLKAETLTRAWQLEGLSNPESAVYDARNSLIYVSNVNGAADGKDGNGFISVVTPDGMLVELNWVSGLDAPKGMAIYHDRLYVSDIDRLVEIDIGRGAVHQAYTAPGAKFLNDVTIAADGRVFVSDMVTNRIHVLEEGEFQVWLEDAALQNPNGLHAERNQIVVGAWGVMGEGFATEVPGHMKAVSLRDKSIRSLGDGAAIGNLDGVEPVGLDFYVTDWMAGKLYRIDRYGRARLLLTLQQGMADHEYMPLQGLIILPMMLDNTLLAYRVR